MTDRQPPTIVLVHGLAIARRAELMFHGLVETLAARGHRAARTNVQGDGTLDELTERLWAQLEPLDGPLALLCHSMGGLQARRLLADESRARRIATVITVGTPHAGTPLAHALAPFQRAYRHLTPGARQEWEEEFGASERANVTRFGIRCLSVLAKTQGLARSPELIPTQALLSLAGPNDGLVSAASQRWGKIAFEVDLDHVECAASDPESRHRARIVDTWVRMAGVASPRSGDSTPPTKSGAPRQQDPASKSSSI